MASIDSDIDVLRKDFKKIDADLAITRNVNSNLRERVVTLESDNFGVTVRCECPEISGFSESLKNEDLEETVLKIFEELDVVADPTNVEDCHWVGSRTSI